MKALVIGGTTGFGLAVVAELAVAGQYQVVTVGRSGGDYQCDVADLAMWRETLRRIRRDHPDLDLVVCVVGYARFVSSSTLTEPVWRKTAAANLTYVKLAYRILAAGLVRRQGCFVAIGSRWSYRTDCELLLPYITAKHRLRSWLAGITNRQPLIRFIHHVVPPMDTPQYWAIMEGQGMLTEAARELFNLSQQNLALPQEVARVLASVITDQQKLTVTDV